MAINGASAQAERPPLELDDDENEDHLVAESEEGPSFVLNDHGSASAAQRVNTAVCRVAHLNFLCNALTGRKKLDALVTTMARAGVGVICPVTHHGSLASGALPQFSRMCPLPAHRRQKSARGSRSALPGCANTSRLPTPDS